MPIIAKGSTGNFIPAPAGTHRGVCVDVVDLGWIEQTWEGKTSSSHKVRIVWQIDELMEDGRPFLASNRYTLSLDPKANLRKLIEGWTGLAFTTELEAEGFDVETLIGKSGIVAVTHKAGSKGGVFANVASVSPLMKGMPNMVAVGYVRTIDRPADGKSVNEPVPYDDRNPPPVDDSDIPF